MNADTGPDRESREKRLHPALIDRVATEADGVISLRLVDPEGRILPSWTPGSHIDLQLASGLVRQYSLCGDPDDVTGYRIGVLLEPDGRGGSKEIHEKALVGVTLGARGPRNHFALQDAPSYLFLAGGIGITPILAMARHVAHAGFPWKLVYGGRTRTSMAFVEELLALPGGTVELVPQDERGMLDVDDILTGTPTDTGVYCCGPEPMIRAVEVAAARHLPPNALHVERFGATSVAKPAIDTAGPGRAFEVELRQSGVVLAVPPDQTLLEVVRTVCPDVLSSCEEGFCGACEVGVLEGSPDHRDSILTDQERERSETMIICVGRSKSARLVLDL